MTPIPVQENVWVVAIQAITPLILLFSLWIQRNWAAAAARHAAEVKQVLASAEGTTRAKLDLIKQTTLDTHTLVNSRWGAILANMAVLSRERATTLTDKATLSRDAADWKLANAAEAAAEAAEKDVEAHKAQQDLVDTSHAK